jgi:hypothetical protein
MTETGRKTVCMGKEFINLLLALHTMEIGNKIKWMDMEYILMQTKAHIKGSGRII